MGSVPLAWLVREDAEERCESDMTIGSGPLNSAHLGRAETTQVADNVEGGSFRATAACKPLHTEQARLPFAAPLSDIDT